jgi:hypothetical protein
MVEDPEIVIKLSGDGHEYGTVTVPASQLDSPGVEEEIRRVYEAGGLPTFMAKDMAKRVVADVTAAEEERLSTEAAETGLGKKGLTGGAYAAPAADEIGFLMSSNMWNEPKSQSLRAFFYYCCCYFRQYKHLDVIGHIIGTEEELSDLVANYGDRYNTLLVFVHGIEMGGHYYTEEGLPLSRVAETCDAVMPVGPGRKAVILTSCTSERIPGYYPGINVMGAKVYALNALQFTNFSYEKITDDGDTYGVFNNVELVFGGIEIWNYLKRIYNIGGSIKVDSIRVDSQGRVTGYKIGDDEVDLLEGK